MWFAISSVPLMKENEDGREGEIYKDTRSVHFLPSHNSNVIGAKMNGKNCNVVTIIPQNDIIA